MWNCSNLKSVSVLLQFSPHLQETSFLRQQVLFRMLKTLPSSVRSLEVCFDIDVLYDVLVWAYVETIDWDVFAASISHLRYLQDLTLTVGGGGAVYTRNHIIDNLFRDEPAFFWNWPWAEREYLANKMNRQRDDQCECALFTFVGFLLTVQPVKVHFL